VLSLCPDATPVRGLAACSISAFFPPDVVQMEEFVSQNMALFNLSI
jgi:hypothetical protein